MARMVIIEVYGNQQIHATHYNQTYATLCGLDGDDDDPAVRQVFIGNAPRGSKIDCPDCIDTIIHAGIYSVKNDLASRK